MKVMSIYDEPKLKHIPKRGPLFGAKSFLAMAVLACGIGLYTGLGMAGDRVQADAEGIDIREVVYQIRINNNLDNDCTVHPGQQLVIRF